MVPSRWWTLERIVPAEVVPEGVHRDIGGDFAEELAPLVGQIQHRTKLASGRAASGSRRSAAPPRPLPSSRRRTGRYGGSRDGFRWRRDRSGGEETTRKICRSSPSGAQDIRRRGLRLLTRTTSLPARLPPAQTQRATAAGVKGAHTLAAGGTPCEEPWYTTGVPFVVPALRTSSIHPAGVAIPAGW